jgi:NADH:ubiquinone oxidoreductase subunit 4 (subunit M)
MVRAGLRWNFFYYTLLGGSVFELIASVAMFWHADATTFRIDNRRNANSGGGSRTMEAMKSPITWIMAVWLFIYMGVEGELLEHLS